MNVMIALVKTTSSLKQKQRCQTPKVVSRLVVMSAISGDRGKQLRSFSEFRRFLARNMIRRGALGFWVLRFRPFF